MNVRRCGYNNEDDRDNWNITENKAIFPIRIVEGGSYYNFCPAKATWDLEAISIYKTCIVAAETGAMWIEGGMSEQPTWFIDILAWFIPIYDKCKFFAKAKSVLGDGKGKKVGGTNLRARNSSGLVGSRKGATGRKR